MDIKEQALRKALALLDASGAQYHVSFEGKEFGQQLGKTGRTRVRSKYALNALRDYVMPFLNRLQAPGDVEVIGPGEFDIEAVRGSISSYAKQRFGSGGYMTTVRDNKIQIMRVI